MTGTANTDHHSMFANVDWMREVDPEPMLDMNPVDAEKRGIRDGDMVVAFNDRGRVKLKARIHEGMRPGAVSITEGWWPRDFAEGSYQELTDYASTRRSKLPSSPRRKCKESWLRSKKPRRDEE